jgi:hypothetical protein
VWLSVIGAVQYGTTNVFSTIVLHVDAQELRHSFHPVMATFRTTETEVVMVVDRSGIHRAHTLDTTLDHDHGTLRFMAYRPGVDTTSTLLKAVAGEAGHDRRWTMWWRSSPALPAPPPGADGASRAPHVCVSLVAHSASDVSGPAHRARCQCAYAASAAKADRRVLARGVSSNHAVTRTILMAVAVMRCCRCVLARPM